ncbi:hypothetical protein PIROE2DRAFT_3209 [Piromyces sp. E2]|nr:hypothetical protein PIROE2DRAFT_3209 [Piromyces sp. E2]|eukprot:OUM68978.1 hypothetical protein PIROE2DRAFT_3209 [Piromyces sp. E2]
MNLKFVGITISSLIALVNVFSGEINVPSITQYKYVIVDPTTKNVIEEETILRTYNEDLTVHEVYNRTTKEIKIPDLPESFKPMFQMGSKDIKPFPHDEIYNVYAQCDEDAYIGLTSSPFYAGEIVNNIPVNCTINIITSKKVFSSTGSIHVIGFGSRMYKKLSWSIKLDKKFKGRKSIKVRALAGDPTLIRERLATELFTAVGVPVQEGTYALLIINNDVYGLYSFTDSLSKKWISSFVHGREDAKIGVSYKMFTDPPVVSDLRYKGDDISQYAFQGTYEVDEFDDMELQDQQSQWQPLINFTKLFDQWVKKYGDDMSDNAVEELKKFLNIESLLRLLAVETLIVAVDNFWLRMCNTALYYNPERQNYQFLPYDFDQSLTGHQNLDNLDPDYVNDCITWVNFNEKLMDHYFTNNIMKHPQIKERYDVILAKTSRETFNPENVSLFVHALADLIREDVQWNFDLINELGIGYEGYVNHYTMEDFENNLQYGHIEFNAPIIINDFPYGLKEWVEVRGNRCRAYTASVDTSDNINISDDVDVTVYREEEKMDVKKESSYALPSQLYHSNLIILIIGLFIYFLL